MHSPDASIQDDLSGLTRDGPAPSDQVRTWSKQVILANIGFFAFVALYAIVLFQSSVVRDPVSEVGAGLSVGLMGAALTSTIAVASRSRKLALSASWGCGFLLLVIHLANTVGAIPSFAGFVGFFMLFPNMLVGAATARRGLTDTELAEYKAKEKAAQRLRD